MNNVCILCGNPLNEDGKCSTNHQIKRMCINCGNCSTIVTEEEDKLVCSSSVNMENARSKALESLKASLQGYELTSIPEIELKPLPLKNPLAKCSQWILREEIRDNIENLFQ